MLGSVWEFPRNRLRLQTVLGEGNFGKVWKAEADEICGYDGTILVAVKTVKVGPHQHHNHIHFMSGIHSIACLPLRHHKSLYFF